MKMLKKGFSGQARLPPTGLQRVMSAREQIPPQYKLNTVPEFGKKGPEAETGNTVFMPI